MKRKAAIELSMNFLVGLIIGIALFSFGIYFLGQILNTDLEYIMPDHYEEEAQKCVSRGNSVCVVEKRQEIRVKKYGGFGLVINNILGREADFKPRVEFSLGVPDDKDLEEIDEVEGIWTHEQVRTITLENNDHVLESLDFTVPAGTKRGDYYFNVFVCYDGDESSEFCPSGFKSLYGAVQQITINVP